MFFLFDLKVSQEVGKWLNVRKNPKSPESCYKVITCSSRLSRICQFVLSKYLVVTLLNCLLLHWKFSCLRAVNGLSLSLFLPILNMAGFISPIDQPLAYSFSRFIQQMVWTQQRFLIFLFLFLLNIIICLRDLSNYACKLYFNETILTRAISETCYGILSSKFYFITLPCISSR